METKNIIVIPDSFKGSMSSTTVADIISDAICRGSNENVIKIPIADGGEGSTDCILSSIGGRKTEVNVKSPENKDILAYYGIAEDNTAIIEIAESSGITKQTSFNTKNTTTYGFGQLILYALDSGCRKFLLCLGGSATTDCGFGMAAAVGARFFDREDREFIPVGATLKNVARIDFDGLDSRIKESDFTVMCDVENPLFGKNGAAYVYAPQKGASTEDIELLDDGLKHASSVFKTQTGKDYSEIKGAGAAGGAGYGCIAFLNAKLKSGIEAMLEINDFDRKVRNCKLIVTGEGKIDSQSFMGKVLSGIINHSNGVKITAFCGMCDLNEDERLERGIDIVEIGRGISLEESMKNGEKNLKEKAEKYFA